MSEKFGFKLGVEGEKEFKSSLADINRTFKVLGSEMKLVQSQFDKNDKSEEALTARSKTLNKSIEAQREKIKVLEAALENASESFGENDKRTKNWQIQLNNAKATLNGFEHELKENTGELDRLKDAEKGAAEQGDKLGDELRKAGSETEKAAEKGENAKNRFQALGNTLKTVGTMLATTTAAIGAATVTAGKKIWDLSQSVAESGDEIDKQSQKLGLSAENYQKLSYAMERSGADIEDFKRGTINISKELANVQNGVEGAGTTFEKLGVNLKNADGSVKSTETALLETIDALANLKDETERNSYANTIFGRSYTELAPLLNSGSEGIKELMDEAEKYGMIMSDEAVSASAAFSDSLTKLEGASNGLKNNLLGTLLPSLTTLMDGFSDLIAGVEGSGNKIKSGVSGIVDNVKSLIPKATEFIKSVSSAIVEAAPTIVESLVTGISDAAASLFPTLLSAVGETAPKIAEAGLSLFGKLFSTALSFLSDSAQIDKLSKTISSLIETVFSKLSAAMPALVKAIPRIIKNIASLIISNATPITKGVASLLKSLGENLPTLVNTLFGEVLPALLNELVGSIKETLPVLLEGILALIQGITTALPDLLISIVDLVTDILITIIPDLSTALIESAPQLVTAAISIVSTLVQALPEILSKLILKVPEIIKKIASSLLDNGYRIVEVGKKIVEGLWEGIKGMGDWLWNQVSGFFGDVITKIKNLLGIHSPSTVFKNQIGKNLALGLGDGFKDEMIKVADEMKDAVPVNFDTEISAKVTEPSASAVRGGGNVYNVSFSFGGVTLNNDIDIERVAHKVSDIFVRDVMAAGGAYG